MPFYEFPTNTNTLFIKAALGLGKTNTLYDFLKNKLPNTYKSCLIISFRRILCNKYSKDLPSFTLYSDITNKSVIDSEEYPNVIVQIDSLKRIRGNYELIIFDELTYSLNHLVSSAENKKRCFDVFKQIMYDNNHIICMDALFTKDWINYLLLFDRKIHYVLNTYTMHSNKKIYNYNMNKTGFIENIKKSIENGENIVIASNNKEMLKFLNNLLENFYSDVKKLFIYKENKNEYDLNQWNKVQVLAYSPSIVAGISYIEKHFDKVFGIFCNTSSTADMSLQQLFRVRNISTNEIHLCCEITGKRDYPEDNESIRKLIIEEDKCLINGLENISINYIKRDIIEDEYFVLYNLIQKNKFKSCNNYNKVLIDLLKQQGVNNITDISDFNINDKNKINKQRKEFKKIIQLNEAIRIANSIDVTSEEIDNIIENKNRNDDDKYILKKYNLKNKFMIKSINVDTILDYSKYAKPLWNLSYVYGYGSEFINKINKRLNYEEKRYDIDDNTIRLGRNRKYEKIALCNHMVKYFGFDTIFDTKHIDIDKNKFKEYITKYHKILELYFKCSRFDMNIFNEKDWYKKCKIYINSKLKNIYKISIVEDRKTKKQYIKGLDFWNDIVTYKNPLIIQDIKDKENQIYDNEEMENILMDILNGNI